MSNLFNAETIETYKYDKALPCPMIDKDDLAILKELKRDSRQTTREIAKKIKSSAATVHRRLNNLVKDGYIKQFTIVPDWEKLGKTTLAYVLINVDYPDVKKKRLSQNIIADRLIKHPCVFDAATVTGRKDLVLKVLVKDTEELNKFINFLRNCEGVQMTETLVALHAAPNNDNPFDDPKF